ASQEEDGEDEDEEGSDEPPRTAASGGLPSWLKPGTAAVYTSRSSGKAMDVKIQRISQSQKLVSVVFVKDGKSEMHLPFGQVLAADSPLRPRGAADLDSFMNSVEGKWQDKSLDLTSKIALGGLKKNFAFQGPAPKPVVDICSSPEMLEEKDSSHGRKQPWGKAMSSSAKPRAAGPSNQNSKEVEEKGKEKEKQKEKEKGKEKEKEKEKDKEKDKVKEKAKEKEKEKEKEDRGKEKEKDRRGKEKEKEKDREK
ncbi:unnamed protein product, partial [Polarella glacialis]